MMNGKEAVELLLSKDSASAREKSESINQYNEERRELDKKITDEANAVIDEVENMDDRKAIVVYNPGWHKGVIGIVASRLTEKYYRPAVVLTKSSELITGSARSVTGFDIYKAIESCRVYWRISGDIPTPPGFPSGGEPRGIHRAFLEDRIRGDHTGTDDPTDRYRRYLGFERDQPEVRERPKEDEPVRTGQPEACILLAWRKGLRHQ